MSMLKKSLPGKNIYSYLDQAMFCLSRELCQRLKRSPCGRSSDAPTRGQCLEWLHTSSQHSVLGDRGEHLKSSEGMCDSQIIELAKFSSIYKGSR